MGKIWMPGGGGGGASSDDCTLMRAAVPKGLTAVTADSDDEALEGTLDTDTTLADSQALSGQTFLKWNPQTKLFEKHTGGMANKGAWTGSVAMNGSITIPAGFHNGSGNVKGPVITNRGNYGGTGNSRGNDTSGKRMWVKVPGGYYNENAQVFLNWSDICSMAGLTADKLKKDVSIMGITGTYVGEIPETYYIWTGSTWSIKNPGMTLTWADNSGGKIPYSAYASDTKGPSIDRYYNYRGNNYTAGGCARINHVFNLTPYKYLKFEKISSGTYDFPIFVGLSTNSNLQGNSYAAQFTGKFGKGVYSIDISKLSGNYYIYLGFGSYIANYKEFEQVFAPDRLYLTTA